ncbi:VOC family protein [Streptacidiphilus fuscans]|uniref:Glyoxalase n=1 Tax=Streptacidiphilus fuscans TaxID=2789292 RepID=A0A931FC11_9ACTN|nr:glyoxalase [Streptacidiphilus fuscans]MBF9066710.1 glyoxalase [Streptacidiphilus fuscans]
MRWRIIVPAVVCSVAVGSLLAGPAQATSAGAPAAKATDRQIAVGPQYDTTHVYVTPGEAQAFVTSWEKTFGGTNTKPVLTDVTPTPSKTVSELVLSPVGTLSVFDYQTPAPYPFGVERTGWLTTDLNTAVDQALKDGADVQVSPFDDPIGKDAVIEFPGGVHTQLYWHTTAPHYAPLASVPENRVYVSSYAVSDFLRSYLRFTRGHVTADQWRADGAEIGMPGTTYRRIAIDSPFGKTVVIVNDGHLPYPFGREETGYQVADLTATLAKARAAGAQVLWGPVTAGGRDSAVVQFPGGYVAEIHDTARR